MEAAMSATKTTAICETTIDVGGIGCSAGSSRASGLRRIGAPLLALALGLGLAGCNTPGERAAGGALIGGATGAAIGGLATGRAGGALVGGALGAAGGALIGAGTAPRYQCPYGSYRAYDGNIYCR
jgi:hypothetical protein